MLLNVTGGCLNDLDYWNKECCLVDCIAWGEANKNGVKHLLYGDDQTNNHGYHYVPNLETVIDCLQYIQQLAEEHCSNL